MHCPAVEWRPPCGRYALRDTGDTRNHMRTPLRFPAAEGVAGEVELRPPRGELKTPADAPAAPVRAPVQHTFDHLERIEKLLAARSGEITFGSWQRRVMLVSVQLLFATFHAVRLAVEREKECVDAPQRDALRVVCVAQLLAQPRRIPSIQPSAVDQGTGFGARWKKK